MAQLHQQALSPGEIGRIVALAEAKSAHAKAKHVREAWIVVAEFWRRTASCDALSVPDKNAEH